MRASRSSSRAIRAFISSRFDCRLEHRGGIAGLAGAGDVALGDRVGGLRVRERRLVRLGSSVAMTSPAATVSPSRWRTELTMPSTPAVTAARRPGQDARRPRDPQAPGDDEEKDQNGGERRCPRRAGGASGSP